MKVGHDPAQLEVVREPRPQGSEFGILRLLGTGGHCSDPRVLHSKLSSTDGVSREQPQAPTLLPRHFPGRPREQGLLSPALSLRQVVPPPWAPG